MAIKLGTEDVPAQKITVEERTRRIEISSEKGADPTIYISREKAWVRPDGTVAKSEPIKVSTRRLSEVADQTVGKITGAALADLISQWADVIRQEDIAQAEEDAKLVEAEANKGTVELALAASKK